MSKSVDKMKKVRAAKKAPTYKNVHQDVPRDDENYLCLKFVKEWQKHNKDRVKEIELIAMEHQIDYYLASILYASKIRKN